MAADVCAEQLPSTSYAITATSSSSSSSSTSSTKTTSSSLSTPLPLSASEEARKLIISSSYTFLERCYMKENRTSTVSKSHHQDDEEAKSAAFPISLLPAEIHLHILKHLPRYDIDNCKFVCKQWKELIDRNRHSLRKHLVQMLELREYKTRFILSVSCPEFSKRWTFCERPSRRLTPELRKRRHTKAASSTDEDNNGRQSPEEQQQQQECQLAQQQQAQQQQQQQQPAAKLPHLIVYSGQSGIGESDSFVPVLIPALLPDTSESVEDHDERKRREHTPPQLVCERIANYFHEADVQFLRFTEMRFTDRFVDRLLDAFKKRKIRCRNLEISLCKLSYVAPEKFHQLLQTFECEKILLIWLRGNCGHLIDSRQFLSSFLHLRFLRIGDITPELTLGDDQFLADFLDGKDKKYPEETILRLGYCSITTNGICQAIDKWRQTDKFWILNLCVISARIKLPDILVYFSISRKDRDQHGAYRIAHLKLPDEELLLWNDIDGLHAASSRKPVS